MIVLDASVAIQALVDTGGSGALARRSLLRASSVHAPHLLDLEVTATLRSLTARDVLDDAVAADAVEELGAMPIQRHEHTLLLSRIWELRRNVTAYDACYVALAEALGAVLLTADERLTRAPGLGCRIELLRV